MEIFLAILMGVSLSAACGFRVFAPMLVVSLASKCGWVALDGSFAWLGSDAALIALSVATVAEIVAYYVPVVDNFLDVAGTPLAAIAGTCLTAAFITEMEPILQWTLAVIAGGGSASVIHAGTSVVRAVVTPTTAGAGNPVLSTAEAIASGTMSVVALIFPVLTGIIVVILVVFVIRLIRAWMKKRRQRAAFDPLQEAN